MKEIFADILMSMFFVYGIYSGMIQIKLMLKKVFKRLTAIDKRRS